MRTYIAIALSSGIAACVFAACGGSDFASLSDDGETTLTGGGYLGQGGGDAGVDVNIGTGGTTSMPVSYAEECGGGCTPGTAVDSTDRCSLDAPGGAGGAGGAPMVDGDCRLVVNDSGDTNGMCGPYGTGREMDSCFTSAQCAPGFGCVGSTGKCRAYCCGELEACPDGTFCVLRAPSADEIPGTVTDPPLIPVCDLADNCMLKTPGACSMGLVCSVVRADGTTACIEEGDGEAGEACPCKEDHVCSYAKNECRKVCDLAGDDCSLGFACQPLNGPNNAGLGICVSTGP